jgi:hypothetical protein
LAGYGPISADLVRELAGDATWRRLLTDGQGVLLEVGRHTYRPPVAVRDFVRARDKTCVFPGCSMPAHRADIDHTVAFPHGPTSPGNLGVMCRAHHRLKVRHEALVVPNGGERPSSPGCRSDRVKLRAARIPAGRGGVRVASGPDKVGVRQYCQMARVR